MADQSILDLPKVPQGYDLTGKFIPVADPDAPENEESVLVLATDLMGKDGNTILSGTVTPTSGIGADGDFYIQTGAIPYMFGPKTAGAWGAGTKLKGNDGGDGTGDGGGADGISVTGSTYDPVTGKVTFSYSNGETSETGDLRGAASTVPGPANWNPVFAVDTDPERGVSVLKITDWAGGSGAKPNAPVYMGATGYVAAIEDAVPLTEMVNAVKLKSLFSDEGNVRALYDGDKIAFWLNAILDAAGGLVSYNGLMEKDYVNQATLNSSMSFLLGQIAGGGAIFNPNTVTGLVGNWEYAVGRTMVGTTGVDAHADQSSYGNHRIAHSAITRPTINSIEGSISFNGSQGLYVAHFNMPATNVLTLYKVCKNTGGSAVGMLMELTSDYNSSNTGFAFLQNTPNAGSLLASMIEGIDSGYVTTGPQNQYMVVRVVFSKIGGIGNVQVYVDGNLTGTVVSSSGTPSGFIEGLPEYTDPITNVVTPATGHPLFEGSRNNSSVFATYEEKQTLLYAKDLSVFEDKYITNGLKLKFGIL